MPAVLPSISPTVSSFPITPSLSPSPSPSHLSACVAVLPSFPTVSSFPISPSSCYCPCPHRLYLPVSLLYHPFPPSRLFLYLRRAVTVPVPTASICLCRCFTILSHRLVFSYISVELLLSLSPPLPSACVAVLPSFPTVLFLPLTPISVTVLSPRLLSASVIPPSATNTPIPCRPSRSDNAAMLF